jgi:N-acetylglucosamine-6-phosphate deacetylase
VSALVITGGDVVRGEELRRLDVRLDDGRISAVGPRVDREGAEVVDADGWILAPGFIDLQCNGAAGHDLTADPSRIPDVAAALIRYGVTAFCPTVVTSPRATRTRAIDALVGLDTPRGAARPLGLHLEGPLLDPAHAGAHDPSHLGPLEDGEVDEWIASGAVRMVTIAPELPGAVEVVERLTTGGIVAAAGHTAMTSADLARARAAGLGYATHLFNAMSRFEHRRESAAAAVLADDTVVAGLICDGLHVAPPVVRVAHRALGPGRTSLVSDAAAPLGAPAGTFRLGRHDVTYDGHGVRLADGTLAGSALGLDEAVRNYVEFTGCPVVEAIAAVTTVPATLLGLVDRGRLEVGAVGDVTVLDRDLRAVATVIGGEVAWRS